LDGKTVLNGSGAPSAGIGTDGDFYIDTTNDDIYGPKTAGAWGSPTSLIGPPGSIGTIVLDDLTDVTIGTTTDGQVLQVDSAGEWRNETIGLIPPNGLEGQIMAKTTDADYDIQWIDNYTGDLRITCKNDSGVTIFKGSPVTAVGAVGDRIRIAKAIADGTQDSKYFLGVAAQDIADSSEGYVQMVGEVHNINTSGYSLGDVLYISPTTAGVLTATAPTAPDIQEPVAIVTRVHASTGILFVRMWSQGESIKSLHDTLISSPATHDFLRWDGTKWVNSGITLGTHTSGNYVAGATAGYGIAVTGTAGEGWSPTVATSFVGAKAYRSSNLSRANNSFVNISFNAQEYDTHAFFAPTSSTMTIPSGLAGYYLIQGSVEYAANATGLREAGIQVNSTNITFVFQNNAGSVFSTIANLSANLYLDVGDTVALDSYQNSGGSLNILGSSFPSRTWLAITYLGA
jgi:hypothetical protein